MACLIPLQEAGIESPRYFAILDESNTIKGRPPFGLFPIDEVDVDDDVTNLAAVDDAALEVDSNTVSGIAASSFVLSNASGNVDGSAAQKAIPAGTVVGTSDSQTLTNKTLGSSTALGADLSAATFKITGLGTPTASTDAATKQYVDDVAQGLHIHPSVVAATTANLTATYSNGTSGVGATLTNTGTLAAFAIDGVSPVQNDRVLIKDQTTQLQNGIYTLTTVGSGAVAWVLTRATDMDQSVEVDGGDFVFVTSGTNHDNDGFVQTETGITIGTSAIVFTQFSGSGTFTAGNGLTLTGNVFSINTSITADLSTAQTLTNKTLTSPTLTTPSIGVATGTSFNSITGLSSTTPSANGTAAVGTATTTARADHVHPTTGLGLTASGLNQFASTTSAQLAGVISDETGSGALVFATSPTLVTPTLGVASATSINKVTITAPATGSTLTIIDGKTLTASNTLTFNGTDASTVAFGTGGTVAYTNVATLSSLSSIGTVTVGTWNATAIGTIYGGTGLTSYTTGDIIIASATNTLSKLAAVTSGYVLTSNGAGTAPSWQVASGGGVSTSGGSTITVASGTTVPLTIQNNGTGNSFVINDVASDTTPFIVNDAGLVGIGLSSPSSQLTVGANPPSAGAIGAVGSSGGISLALSDNVNNSLYVRHVGGGAGAIIGTDGGGALRFATSGNTASEVRVTIDASGNVGIGGASAGSKLQVFGSFSATTKSFDIEHPTNPDMRLRYGSLEGPENGVYIRGKSKEKTIKLPDYWTGLVHEDSITVNVTAIGSGTLYVKQIINNTVIVGGTAKEFFFTIYGERKDVDKLTVEY
jgi:hypothetical protein